MRATAVDVIRHPSSLGDWWLELPLRRIVRRRAWWRWLLFEPGQGWLRWAPETAWSAGSHLEPPEPYGVAPPLRRAWWALRYRARWPFDLRDVDRRAHSAW